MIAWPIFCDSWSTTTRPVVSDALPAANGLITRIGRVGQSWAWAVTIAATRAAAAPAKRRIRMGMGPPGCADYAVTTGVCLWRDILWVTDPLRKLTHRRGRQSTPQRSGGGVARRIVIARSPKGDEAIQERARCPGLLRFARNDDELQNYARVA